MKTVGQGKSEAIQMEEADLVPFRALVDFHDRRGGADLAIHEAFSLGQKVGEAKGQRAALPDVIAGYPLIEAEHILHAWRKLTAVVHDVERLVTPPQN